MGIVICWALEKVLVTTLNLPAASAGCVASSAVNATASTAAAPSTVANALGFPVLAMRAPSLAGVVAPSSPRPQVKGTARAPSVGPRAPGRIPHLGYLCNLL